MRKVPRAAGRRHGVGGQGMAGPHTHDADRALVAQVGDEEQACWGV